MKNELTPEMLETMQAKRSETAALCKNPDRMVEESTLDVSPGVRCLIVQRLENMPVTARKTYLDGMLGKSRAASIKAFCQMCIGYGDDKVGMRTSIRECTDPACPLFPYRPYQEKA